MSDYLSELFSKVDINKNDQEILKDDFLNNKKSQDCIYKNCSKKAIFNYYNQKKRLYCKKHKLKNMTDIANKKCLKENCSKQPTFNYENEKYAIYCFDHKKENMINNDKRKCLENNCNIRPSFNYSNKKTALYCKYHKKDNMINVVNKRKCLENNCNKQPSFNYIYENHPLYCKNHKLNNMIDIHNKKKLCKYCNSVRRNKKYDYYCANCYFYLNPNEVKSRNHKTKENQIMSDLNKEFNNIIIQDKKVENGCSLKRPDGLIKLNDYNIIIEVDENQHNNYSCENKRMMILFQDLGNSPLTIIRFNPDSYKLEDKTIKTPFGITKVTGQLKIINKKEYQKRLTKLIETIKYNIENIPDKEVNIIHLYYDDFI